METEMKKIATWSVALLATMTMAWSSPVAAQQVTQPRAAKAGSWVLIGRTQANHTADHDGIIVRGPFDNFRRIKFRVTDAPLNMHRMVVTYGNGQPDKIEVRYVIPQGGESRVIDLRGVGTRHIRQIDFWYDTRGLGRGRADVTVLGMK
jgi:hypothetical protein